jgi:hypothetical protein
MDQRSAFLIAILEKLGSPLMAAVSDVSAATGAGEKPDSKNEAERMAELLSRSVQAGVSIASSLDFRDKEDDGDSLRLVLAALSSEIIAGQYRVTGRIPEEKDIDRITSALSAVLSFADNFTPLSRNAARLKALDIEELAFDENQTNALFFKALVPVINAVSAYPFGRSETRLIQEIADKLTGRAANIRKEMFDENLSEPESKQIELSITAALSDIYAACHRSETDKLLSMGEKEMSRVSKDESGRLSMDPVWEAFDARCAMLEAVSKNILPDSPSQEGSPSPLPEREAKTGAPQKEPEEPARPAIFQKKPEGSREEQVSTTEQKMPSSGTSAPDAPKETEAESKSDKETPPENPMSFFKPGVKKSGEEEGGD